MCSANSASVDAFTFTRACPADLRPILSSFLLLPKPPPSVLSTCAPDASRSF